jgi:biotin carboxylase
VSKLRKALLIGSSFSAAPIFFALKEQGLHVSVCGKYPSDPCHQYADESYFVDYSNADELASIVEAENFDFLVPSCNDYSYMSGASVAEKFAFSGFDSFEIASQLHTKNKFRLVVEKLGLPAPAYKLLRKEQPLDVSELIFPLLVKPTDNFSGRGMTKVMAVENLPQAVETAFKESRSGDAIVLEQFVEGTLHSHSAFIQDGRIAIDFFVDEFCTVYPYQVNCSNHPSFLEENIRLKIREAMNKLVDTQSLADGLLHTQFICNGRDFWIIETMRRCPGDLYGSLVELSAGIDYANFFILPYLNQKLPPVSLNGSRYYGRHTISVAEPLVNFAFSATIPAKSVDIVSLKMSGEKLGCAPFDKLAIVFAEYESAEAMRNITPCLTDYINIRKHRAW